MADSTQVISAALLARPIWRPPVVSPAHVYGPAIELAPLQELVFEPQPQSRWESFSQAHSGWLVFTSPASVQAFAHWISGFSQPAALGGHHKIAAVGAGTHQALGMLSEAGFLSEKDWQAAIRAADAERADAESLVQAMRQFIDTSGASWASQQVLVIEGHDNRPHLKQALSALGATVEALALYHRQNVLWQEPLLARVRSAVPGSMAVVVTSTPVVSAVLSQLARSGIDASHLVWCTHHQAIAAALAKAGLGEGRIRKVRLEPQALQDDLFLHEQYW